MRLALLSDIHGNPIALDAVLADIEEQGGVDGYWVLGDIAAIGYDPVSVITRLTELPNLRIIRGNADRYLFTGDRPPPALEDVRRDPDLIPIFVEVAHSFAWTQGYLSAGGWLEWIAKLPLEERVTLPDGTRLLAVHAAPGYHDGSAVHPGLTDKELGNLLIGCEADLVCVGHTHIPLERKVNGVQIVNLGSISNPVTADLRASYVLLEADTSGHSVHFRHVGYARDAVIAAIHRSRHPASAYL